MILNAAEGGLACDPPSSRGLFSHTRRPFWRWWDTKLSQRKVAFGGFKFGSTIPAASQIRSQSRMSLWVGTACFLDCLDRRRACRDGVVHALLGIRVQQMLDTWAQGRQAICRVQRAIFASRRNSSDLSLAGIRPHVQDSCGLRGIRDRSQLSQSLKELARVTQVDSDLFRDFALGSGAVCQIPSLCSLRVVQ